MDDNRAMLLDAQVVQKIFPFHIAIDSNLKVIQFGRSISKLTPSMSIGDSLVDHWKILRASLGNDWDGLIDSDGDLVVLEAIESGLRLKGQVIVLESGDSAMFLATPVLSSIEMMNETGLNLQDFAAHDVIVDFLFAIQIRDRTLIEIKNAHDALRERTRNLEDYRDMIETHVGLIVIDKSGIITTCNSAFASMMNSENKDLKGKNFTQLLKPPSDEFLDGFLNIKTSGDVWQGELEFVTDGDQPVWCFTTMSLWKSARTGGRRFSLIMTDITMRKNFESRQSLMMRELDHRVKNSLTTVLSLCQATAAEPKSLDQYVTQLSGRISAMARTHDLLATSHWSATDLKELIETTIGHLATGQNAILKISGECVMVEPTIAASMALVFHELATNAVKYGSFSQQGGCVNITWKSCEASMALTWTETAGPVVEQTGDPGLGLSILTGIVEYELGGTLEFNFSPSGLIVTMKLPMKNFRKLGKL